MERRWIQCQRDNNGQRNVWLVQRGIAFKCYLSHLIFTWADHWVEVVRGRGVGDYRYSGGGDHGRGGLAEGWA